MGYPAQVYNVMIASPGDVQSERNIIREVVHEWNVIHSAQRLVVLLPVGWESHSSPEMGARPQEIINRQVLDNCDLLVGVFWTRIGTETGGYPSGTVEEIERHLEAGRPAMLYFSNKPVHPDSIDTEQYAELNRFRASCQDRGLYEIYDSLSEFKDKFFRHLQLKLNESEHFHPPASLEPLSDLVGQPALVTPTLSVEAQTLLIEVSTDRDGTIMFLRHMQGTDLQTNGKNLIPNNDRRTVAKWEAALQQLVGEELVAERGYKGEVFEITSKGYSVADMLKGNG